MGLRKTESPTQESVAENGTDAAIARLKSAPVPQTAAPSPAYTEKKYAGRDFEKEARGKTRCAMFEAALASPAIAGMKFDTMEQYLALVEQAANRGVAYTFEE